MEETYDWLNTNETTNEILINLYCLLIKCSKEIIVSAQFVTIVIGIKKLTLWYNKVKF